MRTAPKSISPVIHATVFKAANNNPRPLPGSERAKALLDRWLDDECRLRETVQHAAIIESTPEHIF